MNAELLKLFGVLLRDACDDLDDGSFAPVFAALEQFKKNYSPAEEAGQPKEIDAMIDGITSGFLQEHEFLDGQNNNRLPMLYEVTLN